MKADNTTDDSKGYIYIEGGKININSEQDGIQADQICLQSERFKFGELFSLIIAY